VVRDYWTRWPNAGIGLPTGADNGFFVVDADTPAGHNVDGLASIKALEAEHGAFPQTLMAVSPSGSVHRYFKTPIGLEIRNSTSKLAAGVDIRGEGGMALCPPTRKNKGAYRWLNWGTPIAEAPAWLVEAVTTKDSPAKDNPPETPLQTVSNQPPPSIRELTAMVDAIANPAELAFDTWLKIGMAIWASVEDKTVGWELFNRFSARWEKPDGYNEANTEKKWDEICRSPPDRLTVGTLYFFANRDSPGWRLAYAKAEARRQEQAREDAQIGGDKPMARPPTILTVSEMTERLIYISESGAVADRVTGRVSKKDQAAAEYAASQYSAGKAGLKSCLPMWLKSPGRQSVDALAWSPGEGMICTVPENFHRAQVGFNTWRGFTPLPYPENWQERARLFVNHVSYLVPVESERVRFLQWLAHIVQAPEVLPHTGYLFITPTPGTGRNLLSAMLVRALRGFVASGISIDDVIDAPFNGRLSEKLLYVVDEAHEGNTSQ
jgi:hypothetical protein